MGNPYERDLPYACPYCGAVLQDPDTGTLTLVASDGSTGTGYVDFFGDLVAGFPVAGTPEVSCIACGLRLN